MRNLLEDDDALSSDGSHIRSGGDLRNAGESGKYEKDIVCPDGCVMFRLRARKLGEGNPFISKAFS